MVKDETVEKFRDVFKNEYNIVLSISDARQVLLGLVNFFDLLAKIESRK